MDNLTLHLKTVCLVSMLSGVMGAIIPGGRLKKAFSGVCAVAIVFSLIVPVSDFKKEDFSLFSFDTDNISRNIQQDTATAEEMIYGKMLEKAVNNKLNEMGCKGVVHAECEKRDGEFRVVSFTVVATENEKEKISSFLAEGFSGVSISFQEEKDG